MRDDCIAWHGTARHSDGVGGVGRQDIRNVNSS